jgi:hypothetical protein
MFLGVIGGLFAIFVGFFGFGYTEIVRNHAEVGEALGVFENEGFVRFASFLSPLLAIAGGAMAKARALWGGVLLLVSAGLMYFGFGVGVFTMFPIGFCLVGGLLAIAAGKPDEEKAHF